MKNFVKVLQKMVLPSNTCLLCSQVLVLLSSKRASLSDLRSEKCWRILILRSFLTWRNWEHGKQSSQSVVASLVTHAYQITKPVLRSCSYEDMGCRMSFKIHFLHSHLNFFPLNLGAVSEEHGERFHQDITKMKSNYQDKWNPGMMGDFCWMLLRDIPEAKYTRSSKKTYFWLSVVLWIV